MKKYFAGFYFSLPVQLFFLHFRRYQVFLIFWFILFATIAGGFMRTYGANSLYLAPEYLGNVNALSTAIVGFAIGIFIMSWNITTFIMHTKHIRFLATTAQPFLKYCINNAVLPLIFLIYYFFKAINYDLYQELLPLSASILLNLCFLGGFILSVLIAFLYFFGADKTIYKRFSNVITTANADYDVAVKKNPLPLEKGEIRVDWFFSAKLHLRKPRDVRHYSNEFLNIIFKRHHLAAVLAIALALIVLITVGFLSDSPLFQIPAAASITIFFAILIAAAGAFNLFMGSWTIPVLLVAYIIINWLFQNNIIDPRNRAYGLNYNNTSQTPSYNKDTIEKIASGPNALADKQAFLETLQKWKAHQSNEKPVMVIINVSGGGVRSATFTMNVLQRLDSLTGGRIMQQTVLINGASGGMLGAAYFRGLYLEKLQGKNINLHDKKYLNDISKDLLNPLFSSFISRDLLGPAKRFERNGYLYVKDRAYAFEQKLNRNTHHVLDKTLGYYKQPEQDAVIPTIFFNSTITRDGRKLIISTRPQRYLMKSLPDTNHIAATDVDGLDFNSFFSHQNASNLSVLSALRMNATFPYVLPNVWLPSNPVIDVIDAGLRDNYGTETTLRFINAFKNWINVNTSKVVLIQIRDRKLGDWETPADENTLLSLVTKPFLLMQNNWFKLQDYYQADQLDYMYQNLGDQFYRLSFQYVPEKKDDAASLSFHLTAVEKKDIAHALDNAANQKEFEKLLQLLQ